MVIGIILKGLNAIHEKDYSEFIFIFIPQLFLMLIMFGYMDFLIFIKWNTEYPCNFFAPDIKSYLMNIFLKFGELPAFTDITWKITDQICQEHVDSLKKPYQYELLTDKDSLEKVHTGIFVTCILFTNCMYLFQTSILLLTSGITLKSISLTTSYFNFLAPNFEKILFLTLLLKLILKLEKPLILLLLFFLTILLLFIKPSNFENFSCYTHSFYLQPLY